jgi:hypothetical protein
MRGSQTGNNQDLRLILLNRLSDFALVYAWRLGWLPQELRNLHLVIAWKSS